MSREVTEKSPGTILKNARVALGWSLSEVAAMTRIPRTMLGHLEADRFDEYSADVFVRGHLRSYAREVAVDSETVLQAFDRHCGRRGKSGVGLAASQGAAARQSISKAKSKARKQVAGVGSWLGKFTDVVRPAHVVAAALVLVFLFIVVNFLTSSRATAKDPAQFPTTGQQEWEAEKAADQTRWALEKPAQSDTKGAGAVAADKE